MDDEWLSVPEWETPASKGWWLDETFVSSFSVFTFESAMTNVHSTGDNDDDNSHVHLKNVQGFWRPPPTHEWKDKPGVSNIK